MNRKGFTLIELIATIVLLGIVASIGTIAITNIIKESKVEECEMLKGNIASAAKEYASDNRYNNTFISGIVGNKKTINANLLVAGKYLTSNLTNPLNEEAINPSITITFNNDYTVKKVDVNLTCKNS